MIGAPSFDGRTFSKLRSSRPGRECCACRRIPRVMTHRRMNLDIRHPAELRLIITNPQPAHV
jgi:hypothetical protein